ncbi:MAG: 50S ribosomal protein L4, partial [Alistipes sp.]|nr:50S ribosomal protein L4 [Alistipes sp.]
KLKRLARRSALSYNAKNELITVVEDFTFETPKTKSFIALTQSLNLAGKKLLVVMPETNSTVSLSARNLKGIKVIPASNVNTYDVMNAGAILLSEGSVNVINEMLA